MKRSLLLKAPTEARLQKSGLVQPGNENFSAAIHTALERYFAIVERALPTLSIGEWETVSDALCWEVGHTFPSVPFLEDPRRLPALVEDYVIQHNEEEDVISPYLRITKTYSVSRLELIRKLKAMDYTELTSIIQAVEKESRLRILAIQKSNGSDLDHQWFETVGPERCIDDTIPGTSTG